MSVVRDNGCFIEFNPFVFSVKDYLTHHILFKCDSTGDFNYVTKPSPISHNFLVSQNMWHQRLGRPGSEVLRSLIFSSSDLDIREVKCYGLLFLVILFLVIKRSLLLFVMLFNLANL